MDEVAKRSLMDSYYRLNEKLKRLNQLVQVSNILVDKLERTCLIEEKDPDMQKQPLLDIIGLFNAVDEKMNACMNVIQTNMEKAIDMIE